MYVFVCGINLSMHVQLVLQPTFTHVCVWGPCRLENEDLQWPDSDGEASYQEEEEESDMEAHVAHSPESSMAGDADGTVAGERTHQSCMAG